MHFCSASINLNGVTHSVQEVFVGPLQFLQLLSHLMHSTILVDSLNLLKKPSGQIFKKISLISTI
jgi:hypothetical protein